MVAKPNIEWYGTNDNNITVGRKGQRILAIVDHIMQGTLTSTDGWFRNPKSEASAHFGIGYNGEIHQYVDLNNMAWANGILENPDMFIPWLAECVTQGINPNDRTVSIEHEGFTGNPMPEAQYQASLALHSWIMAEYGIPADDKHVIGHNRITAKNRANCPGTGFPWSRLFADLKGANSVSNYDPVPAPFVVGEGVRNKLVELHDVASTSEKYCQLDDGSVLSFTKTFGSKLIIAEKQSDGTWPVTAYNKIQ